MTDCSVLLFTFVAAVVVVVWRDSVELIAGSEGIFYFIFVLFF